MTREERLELALNKIIEMNVQYCVDRYGDAIKAEEMGCVVEARDALSAPASDAPVVVKPLVWDDRGYDWSWWADTGFGDYIYRIRQHERGYFVDFDGPTLGSPHETLEIAKSAAQADYESRILSAIIGNAMGDAQNADH